MRQRERNTLAGSADCSYIFQKVKIALSRTVKNQTTLQRLSRFFNLGFSE